MSFEYKEVVRKNGKRIVFCNFEDLLKDAYGVNTMDEVMQVVEGYADEKGSKMYVAGKTELPVGLKGQWQQYFIEGHHEAIIDKQDWLLVQKLIQQRYYCKNRRRRRPKIIVKGCLSGFTLIDLEWDDEDIASIFFTSNNASEEANTNIEIIKL